MSSGEPSRELRWTRWPRAEESADQESADAGAGPCADVATSLAAAGEAEEGIESAEVAEVAANVNPDTHLPTLAARATDCARCRGDGGPAAGSRDGTIH
jgi:hypothetical protein